MGALDCLPEGFDRQPLGTVPDDCIVDWIQPISRVIRFRLKVGNGLSQIIERKFLHPSQNILMAKWRMKRTIGMILFWVFWEIIHETL